MVPTADPATARTTRPPRPAGATPSPTGAVADVAADSAALAARLQVTTARLARRLRREGTGAGLTPSQLSALASVERLGPLTLGELAEAERVAPPSITRIAAKLEAAGLVERSGDPADRRVHRVSASPAGRRLLAESRRRKVAWLVGQLEALPERDRRQVAAALAALDRLADAP